MRIKVSFTADIDDDYPDVFNNEEYLVETLTENIRDVFLGMDFYKIKLRKMNVEKEE